MMRAYRRWSIAGHTFTTVRVCVMLGLVAAAVFAAGQARAQVLPTGAYQDPTSGTVVQQGVNLLTGATVQQAFNPFTGGYMAVASNGLTTTYANGLGSGTLTFNPFTGMVTGQNTSLNAST